MSTQTLEGDPEAAAVEFRDVIAAVDAASLERRGETGQSHLQEDQVGADHVLAQSTRFPGTVRDPIDQRGQPIAAPIVPAPLSIAAGEELRHAPVPGLERRRPCAL